MARKPELRSKNPSARGGNGKDPMEYYPDRPGGRDQPGTRQPGDEVTPPAEVISEQEATEAAIETGRPASPMPPDDVLLPNVEEAGPERPLNPAWPRERRH